MKQERQSGNASIPSGPLTIGSMETTAAVRLPTVIAKYHLKYPAVDFSLITGPTEKLVQSVLHYELHGAFVSGPIQHPDLSQEKVFEETLVLVTSPTHPWVDSIHELQNHTMLVFPKGCTYHAKLNSVLQDEGLLPSKLMEFGTLETILACVSAGLGITLLPYSIIADYEDRGKVISHPLPAKLSSVTTMFVKRKDTLTTPALSAFSRSE
ncbi:LysR substrate-binding domain-containing protein [Paenibacillus amylolyticus]|nr:LysR substrate-binding domain-containing protein [Paenibacillus amylolyticus]